MLVTVGTWCEQPGWIVVVTFLALLEMRISLESAMQGEEHAVRPLAGVQVSWRWGRLCVTHLRRSTSTCVKSACTCFGPVCGTSHTLGSCPSSCTTAGTTCCTFCCEVGGGGRAVEQSVCVCQMLLPPQLHTHSPRAHTPTHKHTLSRAFSRNMVRGMIFCSRVPASPAGPAAASPGEPHTCSRTLSLSCGTGCSSASV